MTCAIILRGCRYADAVCCVSWTLVHLAHQPRVTQVSRQMALFPTCFYFPAFPWDRPGHTSDAHHKPPPQTHFLPFFLNIFIHKNESGSCSVASHVSVLTWTSFGASPTSAGEDSCGCVSTLYGDPTSLKLCHTKMKSCNDFQHIDMDNNCIG